MALIITFLIFKTLISLAKFFNGNYSDIFTNIPLDQIIKLILSLNTDLFATHLEFKCQQIIQMFLLLKTLFSQFKTNVKSNRK